MIIINRVAVYCGTRNLYESMIAAANSLLIHSNVEQIYFLIEDDVFPYQLPPKTSTINISNQDYFKSDGPNFNTSWTYMVLIRAALSKIFPQLDTILSLDVDTIINENISDIWNIDLNNYYLAATKEPCKSNDKFLSINMGVVLFNLKKLRQDHKDDEIIYALNTINYPYNEQDCISEKCQGYIYELEPDYNVHNWSDYDNAHHRKIIHLAAVKNWQNHPLIKEYRNKKSLVFDTPDKFGLDIIIPVYNDLKNLERTLASIYYTEHNDWIKITVVDDCSYMDCTNLQQLYPLVNFLSTPTNGGPGVARAYGRMLTHNPFIMFIDCGDIIFSKYSLYEIKDTLLNDTMPDLYQWVWVNDEWNTVSDMGSVCTPGVVYKRDFLDLYHINYINDPVGSYSNEDIGFNHACIAMIDHIKTYDETPHFKFYETPVYKAIYDKNSLTHKNNNEFSYKKQIQGLATNAQHVLNILETNNVALEVLLEKANFFIVGLYEHFLRNVKKHPEYGDEYWKFIRSYYFNTYMKYEQEPENAFWLSVAVGKKIKTLLKYCNRVNIKRFLEEIKNNEFCPNNYLTIT